MAKLINVTNIDENDLGVEELARQRESKKQLNSLEVAKIPWKTYLEMQNYNKDKYKMCDLCIIEQKKKFGGRTPIECTGLRDYKPILEEKYDPEIIDSILNELSESELAELKAIFSPVATRRGGNTRQTRPRQLRLISCSNQPASSKDRITSHTKYFNFGASGSTVFRIFIISVSDRGAPARA